MINARTAAAMALVLGVLALALGVGAMAVALRSDESEPGRLVETHLQPFEGDPVLFYLDDFYLSAGDDGRLRALYIYPSSHFGRMRGCKVVWVRDELVTVRERTFGPGLFVDPCGGARFDRNGTPVDGPAERALDYFATEPGFQGMIVDTRTLYCGAPNALYPAPSSTSEAQRTAVAATATARSGAADPEPCDRASPNESE